MGNRGQKLKIQKMPFFSIQMTPIDSINQNDCWQIIFVPKSPKVVEKSRPTDHFRSFFHYFDKSDKRLNGSCIAVKFGSFLFRMSKYMGQGKLHNHPQSTQSAQSTQSQNYTKKWHNQTKKFPFWSRWSMWNTQSEKK